MSRWNSCDQRIPRYRTNDPAYNFTRSIEAAQLAKCQLQSDTYLLSITASSLPAHREQAQRRSALDRISLSGSTADPGACVLALNDDIRFRTAPYEMSEQLLVIKRTQHYASATSLRQSRTAEGRHVSILCGTSHLSLLSRSFLNISRRKVANGGYVVRNYANGLTPAASPRRIMVTHDVLSIYSEVGVAAVGLLSARPAPTQEALSGQTKWA